MSNEASPPRKPRLPRYRRHPVCDRTRPMKVWVTDEQRAEIERRAYVAGLSVSAYLRAAGLNHKTRSRFDYESVRELCKVSGAIGRLGAVLSRWLAEKPGEGVGVAEVKAALQEGREIQHHLRMKMGDV